MTCRWNLKDVYESYDHYSSVRMCLVAVTDLQTGCNVGGVGLLSSNKTALARWASSCEPPNAWPNKKESADCCSYDTR